MQVTIEEAKRLQSALKNGSDVDALLRDFITQLPIEGRQRTLRAYGKYAHSPVSVEDFERESHQEAEREAQSVLLN